MPTVESGKIGMMSRRGAGGYGSGGQDRTCGTCGAIIAGSHVQTHISWHGGAALNETVTTDLPQQLQ